LSKPPLAGSVLRGSLRGSLLVGITTAGQSIPSSLIMVLLLIDVAVDANVAHYKFFAKEKPYVLV
jgi:hypothetical protein